MNKNYRAEEPAYTLSMHPKKFAMWLFIISSVMLFAAFTSAFIVKQSGGDWLIYEIPSELWVTSSIIVISSITMQWAYFAAKKDQLQLVKLAITITVILGSAFLVGQFLSWTKLVDQGVFFVGNPAGSFIYVLTGMHGLHIVAGIIFLLIVLFRTFRYKVHSKNMLSIEMCTTFWHFLGGLWLYLFTFFVKSCSISWISTTWMFEKVIKFKYLSYSRYSIIR